jgi:surface antigen
MDSMRRNRCSVKVPLAHGLLATLLLVGLLVVPATASAGPSYQCKGYDSCTAKGKSDYGYKALRGNEYWAQYPNNNCTNYAAFRLTTRKHHKMSATKPWTATGFALTWGVYNAGKMNSIPKVGAIAWWSKSASPPYGHVAYVERVVNGREVWVSDSSADGTDTGLGFTWKTLTPNGGGWPSGFIHFSDEKLVNASRPRTTGTAVKVGVKLTASRGSWTSSSGTLRGSPITYRYQWLANTSAISGATGLTFTPTAAHIGKRISVKVTVSSPGYPAAAKTSAQTTYVVKGSFANTALPTVSATPEVGKALTATKGTWSPLPSSYRYQWRADGAAIAGATSATYTPSAADEGKRLSVTVTVLRSGYNNGVSTSVPTAPVAPGEVVYTPASSIAGDL